MSLPETTMQNGFIVLLLLSVTCAQAQTSVTGTVHDEKGAPVPGANVLIRGTYDGSTTSADGTFSFISEEKGAQVLTVSYVGYRTFLQSIDLTGQTVSLHVMLKEEANQLDGVVISAGSFTAGEEKRRTLLKPLDIAMTAGATADIAGALNTLPGTTKVGESGRLFVRGGDDSETRTFVDGVVVLDAYGPAAPNTPSRGRFSPFMFKGTSFSTGGYSAEYGQGLSSALILNSKDKVDMNQTDIGLLSVGADVAHTQVWKHSSLTAKTGYSNLAPYMGLIDQEIDWDKAPESFEGAATYRLSVGKSGLFKMFTQYSRSRMSLYEHDIADYSISQLINISNEYAYGNASYQQVLNGKSSLRSGLSYSFNENNTKVNGRPVDETEKGIHAKVVVEHSVTDALELHAGSEMIVRDYRGGFPWEGRADQLFLRFTEPLSATFAEAEYFVSQAFVVKGGARFEYNGMTTRASIDPRISLAWKPGGKGQFSFAYGKFRQTAANQFVRTDNGVAPQRAEHFILNYQILTDRKTFRIETYYKKYDDLIKFQQGLTNSPTNMGNGFARGIELFWRDSETIRNADYWISYSFLDTKRDYLDFPHRAMPSFASVHNFSAVYKHFIPEIKSQLGAAYSFASGRPYYDPNKPIDAFNTGRTPAYHDLSVNVAYLPKNYLILYLSCTNMLGRDNIFGYEFSRIPATDGLYASRAVRQPAPRFVFVGVFITISKNKSVNQLPNL